MSKGSQNQEIAGGCEFMLASVYYWLLRVATVGAPPLTHDCPPFPHDPGLFFLVFGSNPVTNPCHSWLQRTSLVTPATPFWSLRTTSGQFNCHVNHRLPERVPQVTTNFFRAGLH